MQNLEYVIYYGNHYIVDTNLSIIGNVSKSTGIIILNGENDSQTPVQQAFLLQQRLNEVNHPDHTLITYPKLRTRYFILHQNGQPGSRTNATNMF